MNPTADLAYTGSRLQRLRLQRRLGYIISSAAMLKSSVSLTPGQRDLVYV